MDHDANSNLPQQVDHRERRAVRKVARVILVRARGRSTGGGGVRVRGRSTGGCGVRVRGRGTGSGGVRVRVRVRVGLGG